MAVWLRQGGKHDTICCFARGVSRSTLVRNRTSAHPDTMIWVKLGRETLPVNCVSSSIYTEQTP